MIVKAGMGVFFCLVGCSSLASKAGLESQNPVIRIEFSEQLSEPMGDWTYSIDRDGVLKFVDKRHRKQPVNKHLGSQVFREAAFALAPYRQRGGEKRKLAEDCRSWMTDVGSQQVAWVYADGSVGWVEETNCVDDEVRKLDDVLIAIRQRMDVNNLRIHATQP